MCTKKRDRWEINPKVFFVLVGLILWLWLTPSGVVAQRNTPHEPTDDEVNAIAKNMFCPVCENTPLDVCPTQACAEWRELIREKLGEGWNEKQIQQYFVAQFGDRVLATPPARGINWLIYIFPPFLFVAGAIILFRSIRVIKKDVNHVEPIEAKPLQTDEYINRLEKELQDR